MLEFGVSIEVFFKFPLTKETFLVPNLMFFCIVVMELKPLGTFVLQCNVYYDKGPL